MSHKFRAEHGALKTTEGKAEVPSLDKEGWLRPLRKCREASLAGADGVVGSSHRLSEVERTTPAAPPKERDHLLDGAASPPCQGGDFAFPAGCPTRPCPADDLWVMISGTGGVAAPSPKWSRSLLAQTGWSFQMRCFETHSPHAFRGLTTPSAPTLVAFGIIFLMARPPLLCTEGNMFLFNIRSTPCPARTYAAKPH